MAKRELTINNQYMFGRVMCDASICKGFLERVLGITVESIEYANAEQVMQPKVESKGVRLDLFVKARGRSFDIEMQADPRGFLGRRFRYYQAAIDTYTLERGEDYFLLPESYIIFVCTYDPFGLGEPVYTLSMECAEKPGLDASCGMIWVALNCESYERAPTKGMRSLLEYMQNNTVDATDDLVHALDCAVRQANEDRKWVRSVFSVSTIEEDIKREARYKEWAARKEGEKAGEAKGLAKGLAKGEAKGLAKGEAKGLAKGEARYGKLVDALVRAERLQDLKRSADDAAYRQQLFEELGI